jgi:hypothetical protein
MPLQFISFVVCVEAMDFMVPTTRAYWLKAVTLRLFAAAGLTRVADPLSVMGGKAVSSTGAMTPRDGNLGFSVN